jgi:hypothetical protein
VRTSLHGKNRGGWIPEQKISVKEAIKAYTINNAYAALEEKRRNNHPTPILSPELGFVICRREG